MSLWKHRNKDSSSSARCSSREVGRLRSVPTAWTEWHLYNIKENKNFNVSYLPEWSDQNCSAQICRSAAKPPAVWRRMSWSGNVSFPSVDRPARCVARPTPSWDGNRERPRLGRLPRFGSIPCRTRRRSSFPCEIYKATLKYISNNQRDNTLFPPTLSVHHPSTHSFTKSVYLLCHISVVDLANM